MAFEANDLRPGQGPGKGPARPALASLLTERIADALRMDEACSGLGRRRPEFSACHGLSEGQKWGGWGLAGAGCSFALLDPSALTAGVTALAAVLFGLLVLLRLGSLMFGVWKMARQTEPEDAEDPGPPPALTILAPLYREANVVADLIAAIGRVRYPRDRLQVLLLVEADDQATLDAAIAAQPDPAVFDIVPVPPALPRTKPKALNYGLGFARGEIIGVLDAEDRPDPAQFEAAVRSLGAGGDRLAVVQAPLQTYNGAASWIAAQFEAEYAVHFRLWLPFLSAMNIPIALGGTSNYFRAAALRDAGGWDAWNVTEDADLGARLARMGYQSRTIPPPTLEEAPERIGDWLNQRTRWTKGYIQTFLVLARDPVAAIRGMGLLRWLAFNVILGGAILASMSHAPLMLAFAIALATGAATALSWSSALLMGAYLISAAQVGLALPRAVPPGRRLAAMLSLPLYWPLMSIAACRALHDLVRNPFGWLKTPHGVSRTSV